MCDLNDLDIFFFLSTKVIDAVYDFKFAYCSRMLTPYELQKTKYVYSRIIGH